MPRLELPPDEVRLYGGISEWQLFNTGQPLVAPQYLLVIDRNPHVQAALLFWRLLPGSYQLVGASPVSTGAAVAGRVVVAQALFERSPDATRGQPCARHSCDPGRPSEYEFGRGGMHEAGRSELRLQLLAADSDSERRLGAPCRTDGILLPASLIAFLDEYGVLDEGGARSQRHVLPYRGRHLLLVDSERDERPPWSPAPKTTDSPRLASGGRPEPAVTRPVGRLEKQPGEHGPAHGSRPLL